MSDHDTNHPPSPSRWYRIGPFLLDLAQTAMARDGVRLPLTPKVYEILVLLVTNHDRVLTREELLQAVWPDTCVAEANLTQNVSALRRAVGEAVDGVQFIETLPRRGYRFVAPVRVVEPGDGETEAGVAGLEQREAAASLPGRKGRAWRTPR